MECLTCHNALPDDAAFCPRCGARCADVPEPVDFHYAAFISYRHIPRDAQVAKQVQRAIEAFRLPRHISRETLTDQDAARGDGDVADSARLSNAGNTTSTTAPWPKPGAPLGKCFRDQDELAATHSLPQSIRDALAQSRALVVICSPEANESAWVQREIEMFAQLHGRERIFCVLADGSSSESIPPLLKSKLTADTSGVMREMPASPLAADLRPKSPQPQKAELLRTIAAVAGLNYDDLKQRQRVRKQRRIAAALGSATAVVALVGALAFQSYSAHQTALIEESKSLAAQALEEHKEGRRLQVIQTALSALPSSEADNSRPIVDEAIRALEQVTIAAKSPLAPWGPLAHFEADAPIVTFATPEFFPMIVALDSSGTVKAMDPLTETYFTNVNIPSLLEDPQDFDIDEWWMTVSPDGKILLYSYNKDMPMFCFKSTNGELLWSLNATQSISFCLSADGSECVLTIPNGSVLSIEKISTETGLVTSQSQIDLAIPIPDALRMRAALNPNGKVLALALRNVVVLVNLDKSTFFLYPNESYEFLSSMEFFGTNFAVASVENPESAESCGTNSNIRFCGLSVNNDGSNFWSSDNTCDFYYISKNSTDNRMSGLPNILGKADADAKTLACCAGNRAFVFDSTPGDVIYETTLVAPFAGAKVIPGDLFPVLFVCTADGMLDAIALDERQSNRGQAFMSSTGQQAKKACFYSQDFSELDVSASIAVLQPADNPNHLIAYMCNGIAPQEVLDAEYTLDELISKAQDSLTFRDQAYSSKNA